MAAHPRVSIICPTYNRSAAIAPTIESVILQTVSDWELIVVGDGCTDDTLACVERFEDPRVRTMQIPHAGHPSPARNAGLAAANGAVVAYLDHDDRWESTHLAEVLAEFEVGATAVATGARYVDDAGVPVAWQRSS